MMSQGEESIVKVSLNASSISDKLVAFKTKPPPIQKDMLSICNDPYTLAQQLTHVELVRRREGRVRQGSGEEMITRMEERSEDIVQVKDIKNQTRMNKGTKQKQVDGIANQN